MNYKQKKNNIKNLTGYYFDYVIKFEVVDFDNIILDEKFYENILIYETLYKILAYYLQ